MDPTAGRLIGLEHEYIVRSQGRALDFRSLRAWVAGRAEVELQRPRSRLPGGTVVSADENEAEIALPPFPTDPTFSARLDRAAQVSRTWLLEAIEARLGPGIELEGTSTHLSVSLPPALIVPVASAMATSFAPALVLLTDRPGSAGVLTRCHEHRVELCFDFAEHSHLRAAAVFVLGSVLVTTRAVLEGHVARLPALMLRRQDPAAAPLAGPLTHWIHGEGLRRMGRSTPVRRADGLKSTIGDHLRRSWGTIRPALSERIQVRDLEATDRLVDGREPLPLETALAAELATPAPEGSSGSD